MNMFQFVIKDVRPKDDRDGFHMIIHDPFVVPSDASVNFYTLSNRTVEIFIKPKIVKLDESLMDYAPEKLFDY